MSPAHAAPANPSTILVVEDDVTLRGLLNRVLAQAGYTVVAVADGQAAKRQVKDFPVDLVVTDIYMPDGDGVELVMHLREAAPHLPVIVMSGGFRGTGNPILRAVRLLGACRTIEKPFSLQLLLDAVREVIVRPK